MKIGIEVEGIVSGYESESSRSSGMRTMAYPVIRFVTKDGVWVTKKYSLGSNFSIVKAGQKLKVFYNPDNPEDFAISFSILDWIPKVFLFLGTILLGIGIFKLYEFLSS